MPQLRWDDLTPAQQKHVLAQTGGRRPGANSPLLAARGPSARTRNTEHELVEQIAVMRWADAPATRAKWPELRWLFHVPSGGHRSKAVAGKLKASGVRRGVSDLLLPVRRGKYIGCALELKREDGGDLTDEQIEWLDHFTDEGWFAVKCHGAKDAIAALTAYLEGKAELDAHVEPERVIDRADAARKLFG